MKEEVRIFLEGDLLEKYLSESTTTEETIKVERYLKNYPEVRKSYQELQDDLESYARLFSVQAPVDVKTKVLKKITKKEQKRNAPWYFVAASVACIFFMAATFFLYQQNKQLLEKNYVVNNEISSLKNDIVSTNSRLENIKNQYVILNNPETRKYVLEGNQRAKNLKAVAYINPVKKLSMVNVVSLPKLPEDKEFQMWANVDGKMINLGSLEQAEKKLVNLPFQENVISYNISIEPKGTHNLVASAEDDKDIVANISL
ncbi:anti-sigma factor domain-containing protein [Zhouia sp. PK063]|uniref:anti-sigma factor domain-containing protein n=1 Tax=Zhouia sp. PK063 TaxID=3373602 RepID=UPI00379183C1